MAAFCFEDGIVTLGNATRWPFRIRVSMSAMGSVRLMFRSLDCVCYVGVVGGPAYQLAFVMPGMLPATISSLNFVRDSPTFW